MNCQRLIFVNFLILLAILCVHAEVAKDQDPVRVLIRRMKRQASSHYSNSGADTGHQASASGSSSMHSSSASPSSSLSLSSSESSSSGQHQQGSASSGGSTNNQYQPAVSSSGGSSVSGQTYSYPFGGEARVNSVNNPSQNQQGSTYYYRRSGYSSSNSGGTPTGDSSGSSSSSSSSSSGSIGGISGSSSYCCTGYGTGYRTRANQGSGNNAGQSTGTYQRTRTVPRRRTSTYYHNSNQGYQQGYTSRNRDQCPETGVELRIDGLSCHNAVSRLGSGLCYTHEYSSRQCCLACRQRRNSSNPGCEYGDRSNQCSSNIRPAACYNRENRRICCQSCERLRRSDTPGCEYGDRSNQCNVVRLNPGLCYDANNRRMCCQTCARVQNLAQPDCQWGDRNSQLCRPFETNSTDVRINCYSPRIRNICCHSCQRLRDWVPDNLPVGCEYGDHPVTFIVNGRGQLRCSTYFRHFSAGHCVVPGSDVSRYCCHTCHRYTTRSRG